MNGGMPPPPGPGPAAHHPAQPQPQPQHSRAGGAGGGAQAVTAAQLRQTQQQLLQQQHQHLQRQQQEQQQQAAAAAAASNGFHPAAAPPAATAAVAMSQPQTVLLNRPPVAAAATMVGRPPTIVGATTQQQLAAQPIIVNPAAGARLPGQNHVRTASAAATVPAAITQGQNIVINQPGVRPGAPGSQITVPLSTLQGLQPGQGIPTGENGHLLVKTATGQYQILRVGKSSAPPTGTVASVSTVSTSLPNQPIPMAVRAPQQAAPRPIPTVVARPPGAAAAASAAAATGMGQQMTPDTAKLKCKNFLATLLRLASEQPPAVAANVRALIQGLIDGKVEPDSFTTKLQKELNSSPQPCLVPFLKKSLPYLQQSLRKGELLIDGVRAPPAGVAAVGSPAAPIPVIQQPGASPLGQAVRLHRPPGPHVITHQRPATMVRPPSGLAQVVAGQQQQPMAVPLRTQQPATNQLLAGLGAGVAQQQRPPAAVTALISSTQAGGTPTMIVRAGSKQSIAAMTPKAVSAAAAAAMNSAAAQQAAAAAVASPLSSSSSPAAVSSISVKKEKGGGGGGSGGAYSAAGDEDINDVAAMGGVNLAEESQRMQGPTDLIGAQIRSCGRDETFLQTGLLHQRVAKLCRDAGLDEATPGNDVLALLSHAVQARLKTLLEKLSVVSEHRMDVVRLEDPAEERYEVVQDVRGQLRFLGELDKVERRRHDEAERELLLRAAKSRTKTEDPEKERLRAKARELQRIEEEQIRHEKANNTALLAIGGPKKRLRLDEAAAAAGGPGGAISAAFSSSSSLSAAAGRGSSSASAAASAATASAAMRPRTKRVHMRDLMFLMEQEKELKRSRLLWKAHVGN